MASAHYCQMTQTTNHGQNHNLMLETAFFNFLKRFTRWIRRSLIHKEIPKDIDDDDEDSTGADPDKDIDELDPFSDTEDSPKSDVQLSIYHMSCALYSKRATLQEWSASAVHVTAPLCTHTCTLWTHSLIFICTHSKCTVHRVNAH